MTHDEMLDDAAVLALGVVPEAQRAPTLAHMQGCEECRREYAELRVVADLIGLSAEADASQLDEVTSRRMRSMLLEHIASAPQTVPASPDRSGGLRSRSTLIAYLAAAAAVAIALVSSLSNVGLRSENASERERIAELQHQMNAQARAAQYDRAVLADIFSADSEHYPVKGGEVVRRGDKLYLTMWALPPLPHGHVYETWSKLPGQAAVKPGVTFRPNPKGFAIVRLPVDANTIEAVALSVEPEGGSKAPTTTPTFIQKIV